MQTRADQNAVAAARCEVSRWLKQEVGRTFLSDHNLLETFCAEASTRFGFNLRTFWNPKALHFDAWWQDRGRSIKGLSSPFSSLMEDDARLLACAGLVLYVEDLAAHRALSAFFGDTTTPDRVDFAA